MQRKVAILLSGLVAVLMVTCAVAFMASEDSDALIGNTTGMSLNINKAILYEEDGDDSIDLEITETPDGVSASDASWYFNDLDDGDDFVELSDETGSTTTVSVSLDGLGDLTQASVEVVASITVGNVTHTASAVIVVYPTPDTATTSFHFLIKIDSAAYTFVHENRLNANNSIPTVSLPAGQDEPAMSDFNTGVWITVNWSETDIDDIEDFTACAALEWYLTGHSWSHSIGSYGWIGQLLGLETYTGEDYYENNINMGSTYYYWAQYHLTNSGWDFNNETLDFITGVGSSYIALVFWESPPTMAVPSLPTNYP
jgi:hypothetical protein